MNLMDRTPLTDLFAANQGSPFGHYKDNGKKLVGVVTHTMAIADEAKDTNAFVCRHLRTVLSDPNHEMFFV